MTIKAFIWDLRELYDWVDWKILKESDGSRI